MQTESLPSLATCTNTLLGKLFEARADLEDLERKAFPNRNDVAKMNEIKGTIAALELRLKRSMLQQAVALSK